MKFDFLRAESVQLGAVMTDAGANLPGDQRILMGGVIADEQHRLRLVELLQGESAAGCAITQSGDQSGVIGSAVMIDVVGAEGRACKLLEQVILFVGSAIRTDKANAVGTHPGMNLF